MSNSNFHIAMAARDLLARCESELAACYPSGDFDSFPYYRLELRAFMAILDAIGYKRHPFGRYLIRNGTEGQKLENVGTDLTHNFVLFLTSGCEMNRSPGARARVDEYLETPNPSATARAYEHMAIHEMVGTYVKRDRPGIERYYHKIE